MKQPTGGVATVAILGTVAFLIAVEIVGQADAYPILHNAEAVVGFAWFGFAILGMIYVLLRRTPTHAQPLPRARMLDRT